MPMTVNAAVIDKAGDPPVVQNVELADLGADEVLVRVVKSSICHSDVAWQRGELIDLFPAVVGHELAGLVESVGSAVTRVNPGDRVGIALAHHCGQCRYCETARPMLCGQREEDPGRFMRDGVPLTQGFGTGGFSEMTIVRESSALPLPGDVPLEVAAVVGCATSTGLGSVFNIAEVEYGSRVAILGAGGIGLNLVMGCRIAGAERIVVADPNPERRELALGFGATDAVEPSEEALREIAPDGYEFVFESAGYREPMELAIRITERGGTVTLIGVATPDTRISIDAREFVPSQRRILGCLTGNVRPNVDYDRYFRLYARGLLPLDKLISAHIPFENIAEGFEMSRTAQGIRTVVDVTEE